MKNKNIFFSFLLFSLLAFAGLILGSKVYHLSQEVVALKNQNISNKIIAFQDHITPLLQKAKDHTVIFKDRYGGGGAGVLLSPKGYLLTNKHVLESNQKYTVSFGDERIFDIKSIISLSGYDLALAKIDIPLIEKYSGLPTTNQSPGLGNFVFVIGHPLQKYSHHISFGTISTINTSLELPLNTLYTGLYQVDMSVHPGNSGGPVLDLQGNFIGIMTATIQGDDHIGFIVPISTSFLDELEKKYDIF